MEPASLPLVRHPRGSTRGDTPWNPQSFVIAGDQGVFCVSAYELRLAIGISHLGWLQARIVVQPSWDGVNKLTVMYAIAEYPRDRLGS